MLSSQRTELSGLLLTALGKLAQQIGKAMPDINRLAVDESLEKPRQAGHGDVASNIALRLAKAFGMAPPKIAQSLAAILGEDAACGALIDSIEVAGPGFINFRLTALARAQVVMDVAKNTDRFGCKAHKADAPKVLIEFVSANPTGPLHVGHGRQAALGDVLADILAANGLAVSREFYYNDAGAQINNLAISVQARARGISPDDPAFPADGYRGEYIAEIASAYCSKATARSADGDPVVSSGDTGDLELIRKFAVSYLRHEQDLDLRAFGVRFDRYYLESSLYTDGRVQNTVQSLVKSGHTYEEDGALWLRTTDFGDDKDRVMRKSDGTYTYFVPDIAYHVTKWERSFVRAINIQGSDHHGTVARVRAGLQALGIGIPKGYPDYVLHKMVTVMRAGEEVKISKRAGSYVTLRDLIVWSGGSAATDEQRGRDAVRFFLVSRKADSEFVFDVDLALSRSEDNPVYYVQYAHARSCSVLAQAQTTAEEVFGRIQQSDHTGTLSQLSSPKEQALLNRLSEFPEVLSTAGTELAPHLLAFYLRELSADFHGFYNSDRVLVDDPGLRLARLALTAASGAVIANGLRLLGVHAPVRM